MLRDLQGVLNVPGQLAYNPTQAGLAQAFPHGGTPLGYVVDAHVEETEEFAPIRAEELGQVVGGVRGFTTYALGFVLAQYRDTDALALIYPTTSFSQTNQYGRVTVTEKTPGVVAAISPLVFSPDDPAHPGVLVYAPLPCLGVGTAARRLQFQLNARLQVPALMLASRNASGRTIRYGRLADLPLP